MARLPLVCWPSWSVARASRARRRRRTGRRSAARPLCVQREKDARGPLRLECQDLAAGCGCVQSAAAVQPRLQLLVCRRWRPRNSEGTTIERHSGWQVHKSLIQIDSGQCKPFVSPLACAQLCHQQSALIESSRNRREASLDLRAITEEDARATICPFNIFQVSTTHRDKFPRSRRICAINCGGQNWAEQTGQGV